LLVSIPSPIAKTWKPFRWRQVRAYGRSRRRPGQVDRCGQEHHDHKKELHCCDKLIRSSKRRYVEEIFVSVGHPSIVAVSLHLSFSLSFSSLSLSPLSASNAGRQATIKLLKDLDHATGRGTPNKQEHQNCARN